MKGFFWSQVYESLKRSGELTPAQLAYFDREDGAELLYEMRLLSTNRPPTAAYIADNRLDPPVRDFNKSEISRDVMRFCGGHDLASSVNR